MTVPKLRAAAITAIAVVAAASDARAQTPEEFYRGKQVRMIVGHPTGGDYDIGGRLLAKHLSRHVPGHPTIVVQNLPTAASIAAANTLYNTAPKDGTVFGSFSRNLPSQAVLGHPSLQADMRRFEWLGAVSLPSRICVSWHTSRVKTAQDVFAHALIVPGGGASSGLSIVPMILNHALNTKFRIVEGYKAFPDAMLALQRGEVEGLCNTYSQIVAHEELMRERKLNLLFYSEETAARPDIPSIFRFVKTDEQAQLLRFVFSSTEFGRPYVFSAGRAGRSRRGHARRVQGRARRPGTPAGGREGEPRHGAATAAGRDGADRQALRDRAADPRRRAQAPAGRDVGDRSLRRHSGSHEVAVRNP